jgi:hypothetical protein
MARIKPASTLLLLASLAGAPLAAQGPAAAETPIIAPSRIYREPGAFFLLLLRGPAVDVRYTPGSLDRAANLQLRLELISRIFENWAKPRPELFLYVLERAEWQRAGYPVPYGLPVRVGKNRIAAPAIGDDATVKLWTGLLQGTLPDVPGTPILGTSEQAATMVLSDTLVQLQAAEVLIDELALAQDTPWLRGVLTHLVSLSVLEKLEPGRRADYDVMFSVFSRAYAPRSFSASDFDLDLDLRDWLWFQAQFHEGAKTLLEDEGKDAVKKLIKLNKKGLLETNELLRRYKAFDAWYRATFSTVSMRVGSAQSAPQPAAPQPAAPQPAAPQPAAPATATGGSTRLRPASLAR